MGRAFVDQGRLGTKGQKKRDCPTGGVAKDLALQAGTNCPVKGNTFQSGTQYPAARSANENKGESVARPGVLLVRLDVETGARSPCEKRRFPQGCRRSTQARDRPFA